MLALFHWEFWRGLLLSNPVAKYHIVNSSAPAYTIY